jgi:hypothetical protein
MPLYEIVSRGAAKSQFAFAILLQYCGGFLRAWREAASLRIAMA